MYRLKNTPLFLVLTSIAALSMFIPALHALAYDRFAEGRAFFYSGILLLFAPVVLRLWLSLLLFLVAHMLSILLLLLFYQGKRLNFGSLLHPRA